MINSKPNGIKNSKGEQKYKSGLYIPINKDKFIKLNSQGGLYWRSGWEKKIFIYLDSNPNIIRCGAEFLGIPYMWIRPEDGDIKETEHLYYPDFYYDLRCPDGTIKHVIAEVKPYKESTPPKLPEKYTHNQLKAFEYDMIQWNKNQCKWKYVIDYCDKKGFEFCVITEKWFNGYIK